MNVTGGVRALTANGPISVSGSGGNLDVETQNGPISVDLKGTQWAGELQGRAQNGPLTVGPWPMASAPASRSPRPGAHRGTARIAACTFGRGRGGSTIAQRAPWQRRGRRQALYGEWTGDARRRAIRIATHSLAAIPPALPKCLTAKPAMAAKLAIENQNGLGVLFAILAVRSFRHAPAASATTPERRSPAAPR